MFEIASAMIGWAQVAVLAVAESSPRGVYFSFYISHEAVGIDLIESAKVTTHGQNLKLRPEFFKRYLWLKCQ